MVPVRDGCFIYLFMFVIETKQHGYNNKGVSMLRHWHFQKEKIIMLMSLCSLLSLIVEIVDQKHKVSLLFLKKKKNNRGKQSYCPAHSQINYNVITIADRNTTWSCALSALITDR